MNIPIYDQLLGLAKEQGFVVVDDVGGYVSQVVGLLLIIASLVAFVYLVTGGLKWLTAGSDKGKVEEAKNHITNAIIGLTIVAVSWAVFLVLDYFFGLGLAGSSSSSSSSGAGGDAPPGYCLCGNGECAANKQKGKYGDGSSQCYQCNGSTGGWDKVAGTCANVINCEPCPH